METESTATRVARYLSRHIAHLESSLAALTEVDFNAAEAVVAFTREEAARARISAQLDAERVALLKEWEGGAGATPGERGEVRALADRAEALSLALQRAYDEASALALEAAAVVELQANAVRRGAGAAKRFGLDAHDAGGFMDTRA